MIAALFSAVFFLAQFLQTVLGHGPLGAGLRLLPWTATLFFVAPVAGALVDRYGERPFLAGGLALQAVGLGWIALVAQPGMDYIELVPALMVAGAGVSMAMPATTSAAVNAVPAAALGKAAGVNSTLRELGGVFGIAIAVAVFAGAGGYASAAFADGFTAAMLVASGLSLAGALAGFVLPSRRREPAPPPRCPSRRSASRSASLAESSIAVGSAASAASSVSRAAQQLGAGGVQRDVAVEPRVVGEQRRAPPPARPRTRSPRRG